MSANLQEHHFPLGTWPQTSLGFWSPLHGPRKQKRRKADAYIVSLMYSVVRTLLVVTATFVEIATYVETAFVILAWAVAICVLVFNVNEFLNKNYWFNWFIIGFICLYSAQKSLCFVNNTFNITKTFAKCSIIRESLKTGCQPESARYLLFLSTWYVLAWVPC